MFLCSLVFNSAIILFSLWLFCIVIQIYAKLTCGKCMCTTYLGGKTALITGGTSGLGLNTALALAARGCRVIIAGRKNLEEAKRKIMEETGNSNIDAKYLDLSSLASVRQLAKEINETEERLDILINNAGIPGAKNGYTKDGLHRLMQVNHFGPFLFTHLLIGLLKKSAPSKIIFVSSKLAFFNNLSAENLNYSEGEPIKYLAATKIYGNSKLCNIITAKELSRRLKGTGVVANSVHPGLVHTPIFGIFVNTKMVSATFQWFFYDVFLKMFSKNVQEGIQTSVHVALTAENQAGKYYSDCKVSKEPAKCQDCNFVQEIWKASEEFTKLAPEELLC